MTHWVGTPASLKIHTLAFVIAFLFTPLIGIDRVLSLVTNIVSLEAIYLALFIQMSVNRHGEKLKDVHGDIADIQDDIEDLQEEDKAG